MVEKTFNLTWNNHLANLSGLFEGLYKSGLLTDTTLACQDGTLRAHRLVLAACSPYFERVFKEHYGEQPLFILKGVAVEEMECLLHFMYRGSIDVTEEHLPSLIKIATELEIRGLSADHQNEISNPYFNVERNNSKTIGQTNCLEENTTGTNHLRSENMIALQHIKIEDLEVEDDPMIIGNHEDNFEDTLSLADKYIRNFPTSSYKRETRFKGMKRVSVGRVTKSSDFMNIKYKSLCTESVFSKRNAKLNSRISSNCSDPTMPEVQMNHETLQRDDSIDLLPKTDLNVKAIKEKLDAIKREKVCKITENSLRIDKKQYKPYSCDLCTLSFTRASHLARHRRVHTGERPFACTLCPRMFARQDKLKQHLDSHLQWSRKRPFNNEPSTKSVPIKGKRGRPRKVTMEQSAFEEILKFGEFSSMLNKSQSMNMENEDRLEESGKSVATEYTETSA